MTFLPKSGLVGANRTHMPILPVIIPFVTLELVRSFLDIDSPLGYLHGNNCTRVSGPSFQCNDFQASFGIVVVFFSSRFDMLVVDLRL